MQMWGQGADEDEVPGLGRAGEGAAKQERQWGLGWSGYGRSVIGLSPSASRVVSSIRLGNTCQTGLVSFVVLIGYCWGW
jgi:hypothetical protein